MRRHAVSPFRAYTLVALVCGVGFLSGALPAHSQPVAGKRAAPTLVRRILDRVDRLLLPRCLTPAAGRAMEGVITVGALQPVLLSDFTLVRGNVRGQEIELQIQDRAHQAYGITIALPGAKSGKADGRGQRFLFYLAASPSSPHPRATAALLAAASLFDEAIPDTALASCAGGDEPHADRRYPRALALASAAVEAAIVLTAILFGLRAIRPRGGAVDRDF